MHLTSCTVKASWCSATSDNLQVTPADLTSDPQPGQTHNLQDTVWAPLCSSLCCGKHQRPTEASTHPKPAAGALQSPNNIFPTVGGISF